MPHPPARRGGCARNETCHRLLAILLDPFRGFFFGCPADFTDHNDAASVRVRVEHLNHIEVRGAVDRVAADSDARGLPNATARELPDGFVG